MSECTNLEMRELLPDFVRGALSGPSSVKLEDHLAACADCRGELRFLRDARAVLSPIPSVDVPRIVAAIGRSSATRRDATAAVAEARRRRTWRSAASSRRVWLAAASIVAVVGAAVLASDRMRAPGSPDLPPVVVEAEQPQAPTTPGREPTGQVTPRPTQHELVMGGGVSDLADADLESLLQALDDVDTQLDVEPAVVMPVLEGDV